MCSSACAARAPLHTRYCCARYSPLRHAYCACTTVRCSSACAAPRARPRTHTTVYYCGSLQFAAAHVVYYCTCIRSTARALLPADIKYGFQDAIEMCIATGEGASSALILGTEPSSSDRVLSLGAARAPTHTQATHTRQDVHPPTHTHTTGYAACTPAA